MDFIIRPVNLECADIFKFIRVILMRKLNVNLRQDTHLIALSECNYFTKFAYKIEILKYVKIQSCLLYRVDVERDLFP